MPTGYLTLKKIEEDEMDARCFKEEWVEVPEHLWQGLRLGDEYKSPNVELWFKCGGIGELSWVDRKNSNLPHAVYIKVKRPIPGMIEWAVNKRRKRIRTSWWFMLLGAFSATMSVYAWLGLIPSWPPVAEALLLPRGSTSHL